MPGKTSQTSPTAKIVPLKRAKCPTCAKPATEEAKPFCSKRCADLDLGRWLNGAYRIATDEPPGEGEAGAAPDDGE